MRHTSLFVPARLGLAALAIVFVAVASPKAAIQVIYASSEPVAPLIDPVITGQTISSDQIKNWKAKRLRYEECDHCVE
ncbi:MAG: hypothetical protein WBD01_11055, partial [Salaquimonas sp.]